MWSAPSPLHTGDPPCHVPGPPTALPPVLSMHTVHNVPGAVIKENGVMEILLQLLNVCLVARSTHGLHHSQVNIAAAAQHQGGRFGLVTDSFQGGSIFFFFCLRVHAHAFVFHNHT